MAAPNGPVNTVRRCLFWMHLALGVSAGAAILTMSATGAALALQPQILEWTERGQRVVEVPAAARRLPPSELIAAALAGKAAGDAVTLTLTADPEAAALVAVGGGEIRYVDPYSGSVLGEGARRLRRTFTWLTEFHRWFAAPVEWRATARFVTGWSTAAFVILAVSGVFLWIPRRVTLTTLLRSLTLSWPTVPKARDFNWHTVVGFWCAPVLAILALTGVVLAFPWANRALQSLAGTPLPAAPPRAEAAAAPRAPAEGNRVRSSSAADFRSADAAWPLAEAQLPGWKTIALRIQGSAAGPLSFTITDAAHWNRFARSQLTVDGRSGRVVRWEPYSGISRGQRWRGWARFGHTGELGGLAGQLVAGVASAGAVLLVWTGISLALRRFARSRESRIDRARAA